MVDGNADDVDGEEHAIVPHMEDTDKVVGVPNVFKGDMLLL